MQTDAVQIDLPEPDNLPEPDIKTETKKRSCAKAIVWRVIALITTMAISYFYLDDIETATQIGVVDMVIKFCIHYIYERTWSHVTWGYI